MFFQKSQSHPSIGRHTAVQKTIYAKEYAIICMVKGKKDYQICDVKTSKFQEESQ